LRFIAFMVIPAVIHRKLAPENHWRWISKDILPIFIFTGMVLIFTKLLILTASGVTFLFLLGVAIAINAIGNYKLATSSHQLNQ